MANPQPDKFTRISNELYEAIMQTDFSKRQRNILDLVIRMSYGCRKKYAILRPSDFELAGVGRNHIKKELEYLSAANVLSIDEEIISINKNYDQWRVSLVKSFDQEKFNQVLNRNLAASEEVPKTGKTIPETGTKVPETGIPETGTGVPDSGTKVPKTGTIENEEFPKQEPDSSQNGNSGVPKTGIGTPDKPNDRAGYDDPKDSIKDSIKDMSSRHGDNARAREGKLFRLFYENFMLTANGFQQEKLGSYLDDGMEPELIEKAIIITRQNGKDLNYLWGILNRLIERGIKTMESFEFHEQERQKRRDVLNATRGEWSRGDPRESENYGAENGYYAGVGQRL